MGAPRKPIASYLWDDDNGDDAITGVEVHRYGRNVSKNGFFRIPMSTSTHTRARLELEHARSSCYRLSAHLEDKTLTVIYIECT